MNRVSQWLAVLLGIVVVVLVFLLRSGPAPKPTAAPASAAPPRVAPPSREVGATPKPTPLADRSQPADSTKTISEVAPSVPTTVRFVDAKYRGRATEADAFESLVWAVSAGRADQLDQMIWCSDSARAALQEAWNQLSDESKRRFPTPERILATAFALETLRKLESFTVRQTSARENGESELTLGVKISGRSGIRSEKLTMHRDAGGWALAVGDEQVAQALPFLLRAAEADKRSP